MNWNPWSVYNHLAKKKKTYLREEHYPMSSNYHRPICAKEASRSLPTEHTALRKWFGQQEIMFKPMNKTENKPLLKVSQSCKYKWPSVNFTPSCLSLPSAVGRDRLPSGQQLVIKSSRWKWEADLNVEKQELTLLFPPSLAMRCSEAHFLHKHSFLGQACRKKCAHNSSPVLLSSSGCILFIFLLGILRTCGFSINLKKNSIPVSAIYYKGTVEVPV